MDPLRDRRLVLADVGYDPFERPNLAAVAGFLCHLTRQGILGRLAWLDATARKKPDAWDSRKRRGANKQNCAVSD